MTARRFLLTTWEGGGNVGPELGIVRGLIAAGHEAHVIADPILAAEVERTGATFTPWTTAPHRTDHSIEHLIIRDWEFDSPLAMARTYLEEFLAGPAERWAADTEAVLASAEFDAVIADFALPATLIPAEARGIPTVVSMPNIWMLPTKGLPPMGPGFMPSNSPFARVRDAAARSVIRRVFAKGTPAINAARATYGLGPLPHLLEQATSADRILVLTSPEFDVTSPSMPPNVRYVGPVLDDPSWADAWTSPWPSDDDRPLVLVALSSTFQDQVPVLERIVDALAGLEVRAVVTLGGALEPGAVRGRENVVVVPSAPHAAVLEEASVLVTHCGHGTVMKGLRAGVPIVGIPMGRDQDDTAARIVLRGAGVRLKPKDSPERIRAAVQQVLDDPRHREGAGRMARAIADRTGCVDAVEELTALAGTRTPTRHAIG